ncbi:MAG: hypothetical protein KDE20_01220 [Caldilineaceae bacterium]|nr:hypothetical protein [Caldilineaceae bacterium]
MARTIDSSLINDQTTLENPYAKSWIDSLVDWIRSLPVPALLFYAAMLFGIVLLSHVVFWLDGSLEWGSFQTIRLFNAAFVVYPIALYHYLKVVADRSFHVFRPVLNVPDADLHLLDYQLTNLPRRLGWVAIALGTGIAVPRVLLYPASVQADAAITVLPILYTSLFLSLTLSSGISLIVQTVRQLRLVDELHRNAAEINLFDLAPAHAFANLTARASIGLIGMILFIVWRASVAHIGVNEPQLIFMVVFGVLAIAVFFLPLVGMMNRLQVEKDRLLSEENSRIQQTIARIHDQVDSDGHANIGDLKTTVNALTEARTLIEGISAWPWNPGTLRGFASSLLLPIFLWLVTRLLERYF